MTENKKTTKETPPNNPNKEPKQKKEWRNIFWYTLFTLIIVLTLSNFMNGPKTLNTLNYSQFLTEVGNGTIKEVTIRSSESMIVGKTTSGTEFKTYYIDNDSLIPTLKEQGVAIDINPASSGWMINIFVQALLPFILIGGLWFFIFRQAQGANNQAMSFGKSRAKTWDKGEKPKKRFKDVAGVDEALEELSEIVDFLKHPKKYQALGAKIPKGALLMGPPGTGKTLLAKSVAGEADVPFFNLSGSDFVEMFVGVGASRVRDLFNKAKKNQPCIIFVDEIDAVGRQRGAGLGGGHDEREQTLNQLLVEMDGFEDNESVIVMAATNRPDILDPALLRPGRFDRQIVVDKPDIKGREAILKIYAKNKKLTKEIDLSVIAKRTPGFTGADLANLMNEGALFAARNNRKRIAMKDIEDATDRIIAGPEKKSKALTEKEQNIVAYHEVGHAIAAYSCKHADPVHKISILPRGMALGYTLQLPTEDKKLKSRSEIIDEIKILLGGRIAEELIFNEITSGASNDIERATELARRYICEFGMSEKLGPRKYGKNQQQVFLGRDYSDHSKDYSEETAHEIDMEIRKLISEGYAETTRILKKEMKKLKSISELLKEKEVIDGEEFKALMEAKPKPAQKA